MEEDKHYYVELNILLTKLLSIIKNGVNYKDLKEFRDCLFDSKVDENVIIILEGISKNNLEELVDRYNMQFRSFNNMYYPGIAYDPNYFNSYNATYVNQLLDSALKDYQQRRVLKQL